MTFTKSEPPRSASPRGFFLGLLTLAVAVKPLADVVRNYICSDSYEEAADKRTHGAHLLSDASLEKGSDTSITQQQKERKPCRSGAGEKKLNSHSPPLDKSEKRGYYSQ